MLEEIKRLIKEKDVCVLATVSEGSPHCSLMNYVVDDHCKEFYMVTKKNTRKYKNFTENKSVSILVDTREEYTGPSRAHAKAITVTGVFEKMEDEKKAIVKLKLLQRHPYMNEFIESKDSEIFCVKISSFLLLSGLTDAYYESV